MIHKRKERGISLIVLIITIIVIIIISGAVILSITENSPISQASEATFKADVDAFKSDLTLYITGQYSVDKSYDPNKLDANDLFLEYNGVNLPGKTIKDVIPILSSTNKYEGQFEVEDGELVFSGTDRTKKKWAQEVNIQVTDADRLDAVISSTATLPVSAGTDVAITIRYSSNASIDTINLTDKLELVDESNVAVSNQPVFEIGAISGTNSDTLRTLDVTIKTDTLIEGSYKLKLKPNSVYNIYDVTITKEIISNVLFEIDNTPPTNPSMSVNPTGWTNGDVTVTITYPIDSTSNEYSLDGENWSIYSSPITVTTNNTTIYARGADASGNQSGQSTITIANIDREPPTLSLAGNAATSSSITVKATASDAKSGVNTSTYQYSKDNGVTWTAESNNDTYTFAGLSSATYQCKVQVKDKVGNSSISNVASISTTEIGTIVLVPSTTEWTNQNVTVTITYPAEITIKQYSLDNGVTWNTYTDIITMSSNGTVIAKGSDVVGNQSKQASLTITNILKDYSRNGLILQYDGYTPPVNNIWADLSGNGNNGNMSGFNGTSTSGWNTNGISLDGVDDFIFTNNELSYPIVTVQIITELKSYEAPENWPYDHFMSNYESGGYGFVVNNATDGTPYIDVPQNKIGFSVFVEGYKAAYSNENATLNRVYYLTGRYDGNEINLWVNGNKQSGSKVISGIITEPYGDQNVIIGGNPDGGLPDVPSPNMNTNEKVYAVRIYNRALTDDEINRNYQLDKIRFGL